MTLRQISFKGKGPAGKKREKNDLVNRNLLVCKEGQGMEYKKKNIQKLNKMITINNFFKRKQ